VGLEVDALFVDFCLVCSGNMFTMQLTKMDTRNLH